MGDLLFAIANLSRKLGIEPETALRKANEKFTKRFNQLEENFERDGRDLEASTLEEMEAEWQRIKAHNHGNPKTQRRPRRHDGTNILSTTKPRRRELGLTTKTHHEDTKARRHEGTKARRHEEGTWQRRFALRLCIAGRGECQKFCV